MEWTDITVSVLRPFAQDAIAVATVVGHAGIHIEDYADMEQQVMEIAHVDLIEQELLDKPREIVRIHLYVSPDENPAGVVQQLQGKLMAAQVEYTLETSGVQQQDWENAWKKYYHTMEIARRLVVVPSWEKYSGERTQLLLDPGMAFGTGTHETTVLCLEALDERVQGGERMLDIGTGSGILAVAALLLGAQEAIGIDIEPLCVRTANENAQRNGVQSRFTAVLGDLSAQTTGRYDIITANIIADAIIRLAPDVLPLLAKDGLFVASGIIAGREQEVANAMQAAGLHIREFRRKNGWVAILAALPQ